MNTTLVRDFEVFLKSKNYSGNTIKTYSSCLALFLRHFKKSPQNISLKEIREFLASQRTAAYMKQYVGTLRILYTHVIRQPQKVTRITYPRTERHLPEIIDRHILVQRIDAVANLKHRAILATLYGAGLRRAELLHLTIADLAYKAGHIRVKQGKGKKDRLVPISDKLVQLLRDYYRAYRPKEWLFEGQTGGQYSEGSLRALTKQHIGHNPHKLRHSYATHHIENGTDVSVVQKLMGHKSIKTTSIYVHVSDRLKKQVKFVY
jgi:integrase/recombinase XerD